MERGIAIQLALVALSIKKENKCLHVLVSLCPFNQSFLHGIDSGSSVLKIRFYGASLLSKIKPHLFFNVMKDPKTASQPCLSLLVLDWKAPALVKDTEARVSNSKTFCAIVKHTQEGSLNVS